MWIASNKRDLKAKLPNGGSTILVPTMGALHEGHLALIKRARDMAVVGEQVIVSIFVNPLQFDRKTDLEKYPRELERDLQLCRENGADGVFCPSSDEMYETNRSITVIESKLATHLCGKSRPGHFDGVCTVVLKLFNLSQCRAAIFGEKDFQQLVIIRRMIRDLDLKIEIVGYPTLREEDGLAMSSRNSRLNNKERVAAADIRKALLAAKKEPSIETAISKAMQVIKDSPLAKIDYLTAVDSETLENAVSTDQRVILACAVYYGEIRLIDHITLNFG